MSSAASTGHKSSFAKTQPKSPLPPKRPWVGNSQPRMHRGPEGAAPRLAHALFGDASPTSSPSKVRQRRVPQPDEPTTPTRNSEGSAKENVFQRREHLKDDSSTFTKGRVVVTPAKTLRPGVGATPPRSPKRPYLGSPKYQKVILERPAFYSAPMEESKSEQPKKEVSIAELQDRLKKFLQDDATATTLEVPFTISSSPRVNPLFHHDHTPLQVAKGGVAFTAGASDEPQTLNHSPRSHPCSDNLKEVLSDDSCTTMEGEMESSVSQSELKGGVPVAEVSPLPRLLHVAKGGVSFTAGASEEFVSDSTETLPDPNLTDFPVHSEIDTFPPQLVGNMPNRGKESVEHTQTEGEMENRPELAPTSSVLYDTLVDSEHDQDCNGQNRSGVTDLLDSNFPAKDRDSVTTGETPDLQTVLEADFDLERTLGNSWERFEPEEVNDEIDFEEDSPAVQSWPRRLLNNIMLLSLVMSLMGVMVLASGSQGLLPKVLHANPLANSLRDSSLSTPFLPISTGMEGLWKQNGKLPSQPFAHFRTEFLEKMLAFDMRELEGFADGYANGYPSLSLSKHEIELSMNEDLKDQDHLRAHFQDLREKLMSNVAGLTSDMNIYEPSQFEMQMSPHIGECLEDETRDGTGESLQPEPLATWSKSREKSSPEAVGDSPLVEIEDLGSPAVKEIPIAAMEVTEEDSDVVAPNQSALRDLVHSLYPHQFSGVSGYTLEEQVSTDVQVAGQQPQIVVMTLKEDFLQSEPDVVEVLSVVETTEIDISTAEPSSVMETTHEVSRVTMETLTDTVSFDFPLLTIGKTYSPKVDVPELPSDKLFDTAPEDSQVSDIKGVPVSKEIVVESAEEIPLRAHQTKEIIPPDMTTSKLEEASLSSNGFPLTAAVSILVATLTISLPFFLKYHKSTTSIERKDVHTPKESMPVDPTYFPVTETLYKPSVSSAAWPSTPSVYDTHIPDKQELDAVSSPVSRVRTPGKSALQKYSKDYNVALPAMSAPAYIRPTSYFDEKPTSSAQTWHCTSAVHTFGKTTSSSSFRQTALYMPSESGMSSSGRGSEVDSVAESVLSMGSGESEELGSFTTCELISVTEGGGGGEQMRRLTPVRRSKRIRNQATSPIPARFSGVAL